MSLRTPFFASITALAIATMGVGQGPQKVVGGGCEGRSTPVVTGPQTLGSTLVIESMGCAESAKTTRVLLVGVALPRAEWVPLRLLSSFAGYESCAISVVPVFVTADLSAAKEPLKVPIPSDPVWRGLRLGLQTYCVECGSAACFPSLTAGLEVLIL